MITKPGPKTSVGVGDSASGHGNDVGPGLHSDFAGVGVGDDEAKCAHALGVVGAGAMTLPTFRTLFADAATVTASPSGSPVARSSLAVLMLHQLW